MSQVLAYRFGPFELAVDPCGLSRSGEKCYLTQPSCKVLLFLIRHRGRVQHSDQLVKVGWGDSETADDTNLQRAVRDIRTALGGARERWLKTVKRQGYEFDAGVDVQEVIAGEELGSVALSCDDPRQRLWTGLAGESRQLLIVVTNESLVLDLRTGLLRFPQSPEDQLDEKNEMRVRTYTGSGEL